MKIKTNLRAGKGSNSNGNSKGRSGGADDTVHPEDVQPVYVPPVSRCVGL